MDGFAVKMQTLSDILTKKDEALRQILAITENQGSVLAWDSAEQGRELFFQMNAEKQKLIGLILQFDSMFDNIFLELGEDFEKKAPDYSGAVRNLQNQIKGVTDLDVKIRFREGENLKIIPDGRAPNRPAIPKAPVKKVLEEYRRHSKKQ